MGIRVTINGIGRQLSGLRLKRRLSLLAVARRIGIGKSTLARWEAGDVRHMPQWKLNAWRQALGLRPVAGKESR